MKEVLVSTLMKTPMGSTPTNTVQSWLLPRLFSIVRAPLYWKVAAALLLVLQLLYSLGGIASLSLPGKEQSKEHHII
jgi:hypothetical protein